MSPWSSKTVVDHLLMGCRVERVECHDIHRRCAGRPQLISGGLERHRIPAGENDRPAPIGHQFLDRGQRDLGSAPQHQDGLHAAEGITHVWRFLLVEFGSSRPGADNDRAFSHVGERPIARRLSRVSSLRVDMSTRKLIIAALLCGLAILVAFTVQVLTIR